MQSARSECLSLAQVMKVVDLGTGLPSLPGLVEDGVADYIKYDDLTQAAMRGVMRETLKQVAANGAAPGNHHFYITFRTKAPGVKAADYLVERFPEEMTIVVQHQFWDMLVHDAYFEVILKFSGIPQHLEVPYAAVTRFIDPSVNFGLSFEKANAGSGVVAPALEPMPDRSKSLGGADGAVGADGAAVVSLDAFRKR